MVFYGYICTLSTEWEDTFYFVLAQIASGSSMNAGGPFENNKILHMCLENFGQRFEVYKKPS